MIIMLVYFLQIFVDEELLGVKSYIETNIQLVTEAIGTFCDKTHTEWCQV